MLGIVPGYALLILNGRRLNCANLKRSIVVLVATAAAVMALHILRTIIGIEVIATMLGQDANLTRALSTTGLTCLGLAGALVATTLQMDATRFALVNHRISPDGFPLLEAFFGLLGYLAVIALGSKYANDPVSEAFAFLLLGWAG